MSALKQPISRLKGPHGSPYVGSPPQSTSTSSVPSGLSSSSAPTTAASTPTPTPAPVVPTPTPTNSTTTAPPPSSPSTTTATTSTTTSTSSSSRGRSSSPPVDQRRSASRRATSAPPARSTSMSVIPNPDAKKSPPPSAEEESVDTGIVSSWFADRGMVPPALDYPSVVFHTYHICNPPSPSASMHSHHHTSVTTEPQYCISISRNFYLIRDRLSNEILDIILLSHTAAECVVKPATKPPYCLSPTLNEISHKGKVGRSSLRENLTQSASSLQTLQQMLIARNSEQTSNTKVATIILELLHTHFKELPDFTYQMNTPSHRWSSGTGLPGSLVKLLVKAATDIFKREETLIHLKPPVYVIGDLHGNFKDFVYFAKAFGLWEHADFVPANFLFLGDYVDRGPHSVEMISYLLSLKVQWPGKIFLLRGNHEVEDINGDETSYQDGSFKRQCKTIYGETVGTELWTLFNRCFDYMPLVSIVDRKVFCVHAGIPRTTTQNPPPDIFNMIAAITRPPALYTDLFFDLLWSDPATSAEEDTEVGKNGNPPGFGQNSRGSNTRVFGREAVQTFCKITGCSHIIRAHQSSEQGVELAKQATIMTLFSSSNYCGGVNLAAAILVHDRQLRLIIKKHSAVEQDAQVRVYNP